jgi:hypothetical protein
MTSVGSPDYQRLRLALAGAYCAFAALLAWQAGRLPAGFYDVLGVGASLVLLAQTGLCLRGFLAGDRLRPGFLERLSRPRFLVRLATVWVAVTCLFYGSSELIAILATAAIGINLGTWMILDWLSE